MPYASSLPEAFHQRQAVQTIGKQQMTLVRHSTSEPCLRHFGIFNKSIAMILRSCNANPKCKHCLVACLSGSALLRQQPNVVLHSGSLAPAYLTNGTAAVSMKAGTMWCSSPSLTGRCGDASSYKYVFVVTLIVFFIVTALFIPFH